MEPPACPPGKLLGKGFLSPELAVFSMEMPSEPGEQANVPIECLSILPSVVLRA